MPRRRAGRAGRARPRAVALADAGIRATKLRFHHADWREDVAVIARSGRPSETGSRSWSTRTRAGGCPATGRRAGTSPPPRGSPTSCPSLGVYWLEEPLRCEDYDGYAALRRRTDLRIAAGEMVRTMAEARDLVVRGGVDVLQTDVVLTGGVSGNRRIAALADLHGRTWSPHTWSNGYGLVANLHVACAFSTCPYIEVPVRPARLVGRASRLPAAGAGGDRRRRHDRAARRARASGSSRTSTRSRCTGSRDVHGRPRSASARHLRRRLRRSRGRAGARVRRPSAGGDRCRRDRGRGARPVRDSLGGCAVFDGVVVNPGLQCVADGIAVAQSERADVVIGLGGGACLDTAKAIALGAVNDIAIRELDYRAEHLAPGTARARDPDHGRHGVGNQRLRRVRRPRDRPEGLPRQRDRAALRRVARPGADRRPARAGHRGGRYGRPLARARVALRAERQPVLGGARARCCPDDRAVPAARRRRRHTTSRRAASCCSRRIWRATRSRRPGSGWRTASHTRSRRTSACRTVWPARSRCRRCWPSAVMRARSVSPGSLRRSVPKAPTGRSPQSGRCPPRSARPCSWPIAA